MFLCIDNLKNKSSFTNQAPLILMNKANGMEGMTEYNDIAVQLDFLFRSDGRPVSGRFCSTLPLPGEVSVSCSVECPLDCVLSSWSPWDESQCQCGLFLANITRTR